MDAKAKKVSEILHSGDQYLVPFFQRSYSWTRKHWERLFDDVLALMQDGGTRQHFLGPLDCTAAEHTPTVVPGYLLIDGQQRLTTLTILLAALRDVAKSNGLKDLADEIMENFLIHKRKKELQRYKVVPRLGDREILAAVVDGDGQKQYAQSGIMKAYRFFRSELEALGEEKDGANLEKLFHATTLNLSLVVVTIDGENPYEIFESLNSTGLPLEESDLIRNFLFMLVPLPDQADFNDKHWQPLEAHFEDSADRPGLQPTPFYRNYVMRDGAYSRSGSTFVDFKDQYNRRRLNPQEQMRELRRFAGYEVALRHPESYQHKAVRESLMRIAQLEITTAYPLLLNLLDRFDREEMDEEALLGCLTDLESFAIRRSICGESNRSYARWFPEAIFGIRQNPRDDLRQYWFRRGWPDDAAFAARLQDFPIYRRESKKARVLLEALERSHRHKEKVDLASLTIEHIMPQTVRNDEAGRAWQKMLGPTWQEVHENLLHTLGNLTLTGYNPELSNRPYASKRKDFAHSNVVLNRYFETVDAWDEAAVRKRTAALTEKAVELWPRPSTGPAYALPDEEEGEENGTTGSENTRQFRLEYWDALNDLLAEREGCVKPRKSLAACWMGYALGRSYFWLNARIHMRERRLTVLVGCTGPVGRLGFRKLEADKDAIESEAGETFWWQYCPDRVISRISLVLDNADPLDENDRQRQVEWIADKLEMLYRVFSPRLKAMDLPKGKEESAKAEV